jgi:mevalonate kinase
MRIFILRDGYVIQGRPSESDPETITLKDVVIYEDIDLEDIKLVSENIKPAQTMSIWVPKFTFQRNNIIGSFLC